MIAAYLQIINDFTIINGRELFGRILKYKFHIILNSKRIKAYCESLIKKSVKLHLGQIYRNTKIKFQKKI